MKPKVPDKRGNNKWKCEECSKEFKFKSEKVRHEKSHVAQFQCKICSKKFSFLSAVRRHEKLHERVESVQCDLCNRKFRDKALLKRHLQYSHKGTFPCKKCKSTFHSEVALQTHMKTHKPHSERRYQCNFHNCGKSFNFPHHLKHHELTHTNDKQHFCLICGKGFIQQHHLKVHQRSHEPETWLPCLQSGCNKKYTNEYALKRHLVTHKNKQDSGISSDSSTNTISVNKNSLTVYCATRRKKKMKNKNDKHLSKCRIQNEAITDELHNDATVESLNYNTEETFYVFPLEEDDEVAKVLNNNSDVPMKTTEVHNYIAPAYTAEALNNIESFTDVNSEGNNLPFSEVDKDIKNNSGETDENPKDLSIDKVDDSIRTCKATIGCCIVTGSSEISSNCICAQMIYNDEELNDLVQNTINTDVNEGKSKGRTLNKSVSVAQVKEELKGKNAQCDTTMCDTCDCAKTCPINPKNRYVNSPITELKTDGTVKIKEAFDFDFEMDHVSTENENIIKKDIQNKNNIGKYIKKPVDLEIETSNNCKEVLGSCIVSGNGTISEDCLCAKMSLNNQEIIDQEIEVITPNPKNNNN